MVARLISTIVILVAIAFFAGFNLENKCDVNLLFYTFKNAPVFFTVIFSFIAGIIFTIPFAFFARGKKKNNSAQGKAAASNVKKEKKMPSLFRKNKPAEKNDGSPKSAEPAVAEKAAANAEPSAVSPEQNGSES